MAFKYSLAKFIPFRDEEACARVRAIKRKEACLDMKAALASMHPQDARRRHLAEPELPESVLDRGNGCIRREEPLDIVP